LEKSCVIYFNDINIIDDKKRKNMRETILTILQMIRADVDFTNQTALVDDGVLDSMDIVALVNALEKTFKLEIDYNDAKPVNYNSVENIQALIERLSK